MKTRPRVGAVIVNYNCAPLALDAALSVIGASDGAAEVIIVDNASPDSSANYLRGALRGDAHRPISIAASPRPLFADLTQINCATSAGAVGAELKVLFAPSNGGFAAGCNLGLRALQTERFDLLLLLNPDAVLAAGAIEAFWERLNDPRIGLCGASVLAFDAPHAAQALGGARLDPLTLLGENLGAGLALDTAPDACSIERRLDYPLGAAIAFRPDYLARVGYLDERYFLYYEEADWAFCGRSIARVGWARSAVVYHRYGASSKSLRTNATAPSNRSPLSDYHMARSRLLFARKWRPHLVPGLVALGGVQAAGRVARGKMAQARAVALGSLPGAARVFPSA